MSSLFSISLLIIITLSLQHIFMVKLLTYICPICKVFVHSCLNIQSKLFTANARLSSEILYSPNWLASLKKCQFFIWLSFTILSWPTYSKVHIVHFTGEFAFWKHNLRTHEFQNPLLLVQFTLIHYILILVLFWSQLDKMAKMCVFSHFFGV